VPQMVTIDGRCYLLFSVAPGEYSRARLARAGVKAALGTHYLAADNPLGPYHLLTDDFLIGDGLHYSARFVEFEGRWHWMAFKNIDARGEFIGEISDPQPVYVQTDGTLALTEG